MLGLLLLPASAAWADDPLLGKSGLSFMTASGPKQYPVLTLLEALIALMLAVVVIVALFVVIGMFLRRAAVGPATLPPPTRAGSGLSFIYIGLALTIPLLVGIAAWTYAAMAHIGWSRNKADFTIEVTAHQWWWQFRYVEDGHPERSFTTANEIRIPTGKPVRIVLQTADVIHSFWIPALAGKTDTIAGQRNVTWLQADTPGTYRGQCTEYCGLQHAHMALLAIAEPPEQFAQWWQHQLEAPRLPLADPARRDALEGQQAFMRNCALCHAVRGTDADGRLGPDLSHLMQRRSIAAGTLPNTVGYLSAWISSPQHIKPGNYMPTLTLSAAELDQIRTYLEALR